MPYLLILPSVAVLALLFVVPLVQTIWLAVADNGAPALANAERRGTDINCTRSVKNTFLLTIAV
ncbi:sugar ABC transporter permease, partial [Rhizobium brockwellii]